MITGFRGTFVISWAQTELDGLSAASPGSLSVGALWQWHGAATRIDGPGDVLVLGQCEETARLRQHAARGVRRLVHLAMDRGTGAGLHNPQTPVLDRGFAVTDGVRIYTATLIEVPERQSPLLMFLDQMPPKGHDLWITHVTDQALHANRSGDVVAQVICFTPDTRIATPDGPRLVGELQVDDLILTKDDGPQRLRWIGQRRISGARLYAMPELRPIRIRAGAVGMDVPDADLVVSPQHRMLLRGKMARALFNTDEVLIAARDLVNDHSIIVDRQLKHVTYIHLLLDRHQIVFANGLESESFHPAAVPLQSIDPAQQQSLLAQVPGLDRDASVYGAPARRILSSAEAAILQHKGFGPH